MHKYPQNMKSKLISRIKLPELIAGTDFEGVAAGH